MMRAVFRRAKRYGHLEERTLIGSRQGFVE
jgi:hypothetical protein